MNRSNLTKLLLGMLSLLPVVCKALPDDRSQPIYIKSDTAEINDAKGISIYRGKVTIDQGTINLKADTITIYNGAKGISRLVAIGEPAHYQQQHRPNEPLTHAFGNTIEYFLTDERIAIVHSARLEQEQNSFAGDRIDYDMKRKVVNAYSDSSPGSGKKSRVEMIIQPNKTLIDSGTDDSDDSDE